MVNKDMNGFGYLHPKINRKYSEKCKKDNLLKAKRI